MACNYFYVSTLFVLYLLLPYINGPCSVFISMDVRSELGDVVVNGTTLGIPYSVFHKASNSTLRKMYSHKVEYNSVRGIDNDDIRAKVEPICKGNPQCLDTLIEHIRGKLHALLHHVNRRRKCFSYSSIARNAFWGFSPSTWCLIYTSNYAVLDVTDAKNVSESIKSFLQVHALLSTLSGVDIKNFENMLLERLVDAAEQRRLHDHGRWLSFSVIVLGLLFALLHNFSRPRDTSQCEFAESKFQKDVNMDGAYRSRFLVASLVIFSHSYGFVQQQHLEPVRYHFKGRPIEGIGTMSLSVTFFLSGFLCQASSCKMFDADAKRTNWKLIPLRDRILNGAMIFIKRCNRIFASYFKAIVIIASLLWLLESMHDPNGIGRPTGGDVQRDYILYFAGSVENAFSGIFRTPLLEPKKAINSVFAGAEINDSLWTIPHQIFCYLIAFVVDTLSNSDAKITLLTVTFFIYYILRVIYVIDIYSIPRDYEFLPKMKAGGQSRRFNLYANFALGGLWYHLCRVGQVSVSYKGSLSNLLHYAPFALFLIIPWILGSSCLFSIFSPPLFGIFSIFISMGSNKDMDDGVFCDKAMRNAVYKSARLMYFYAAPIQKILVYRFHFFSPIDVALVSIVVCIGLHNATRYISRHCGVLFYHIKAEILKVNVALYKEKGD